VFDSGVGGLTIVSALRERLPNEAVLYFGDTAHLPYGDKSPDVLHGFVRHIADFLLHQHVKAIVIACNTASAVAFEVVEAACKRADIPCFEVIAPAVEAAAAATRNTSIGVIGTQTTILSHVYLQRLLQVLPTAYVVEKATPLLVPLIEEGWLDHALARQVIEAYMSDTNFRHIDTLILGCTHYPLIQPHIEAYFAEHGRQMTVVNSSETTANYVWRGLDALGQLAAGAPQPGQQRFYVSDYTEAFQAQARRFFGGAVELVKLRPEGLAPASE
jgi:glutamate racemase